MPRGKKNPAAPAAEPVVIDSTVTATVHSAPGLNLRQHPALNAPVLRVLEDGEQITLDSTIEAPGGWKAVAGGGFVMAQYIE